MKNERLNLRVERECVRSLATIRKHTRLNGSEIIRRMVAEFGSAFIQKYQYRPLAIK